MIGRLRGKVWERTPQRIILDVGGVGYVVNVTTQVALRPGEQADLHVHTAVRDDAITLFGFATAEEKDLFDLLIGVPGVGPVKAMGILQTPVETFVELVARREPGQLAKLPGVGKKTAERILVDLADKVASIAPAAAVMGVRLPAPAATTKRLEGPPVLADLVSALVNLGFKEATAVESAKASLEGLGESASLEDLLRDALARNRPRERGA